MTEIMNLGQDIVLTGKSGTAYQGRILDKECTTLTASRAIACLSNSSYYNGQWHHQIKDIYDTDNERKTLEEFKKRDDVSHLILIPKELAGWGPVDKIQDLIQSYIHK